MNLKIRQSGGDFWQELFELVTKIPFCLFGLIGKVLLCMVFRFVTMFVCIGMELARRTLLSSK